VGDKKVALRTYPALRFANSSRGVISGMAKKFQQETAVFRSPPSRNVGKPRMICIAYTVALNRACTNTAPEFESRFNTRRVTIGYYELASDGLPNVSFTHNSTKQ